MLVYSSIKSLFSEDVLSNQIVDKILLCLKKNINLRVAQSEIRAFQNSLRYMDKVLQDPEIPDNSGISIEYQIPQTGKRIDFIVSGSTAEARAVAVLIELKQWQEAWLSEKDGIVSTIINGGKHEVSHPSYQAWSYAALLQDFNETVQEDDILLKPCAYLHNYHSDDVIANDFYRDHLKRAPVFFKSDAVKLREFIKSFVKKGDGGDVMYRIDNGRIRPSKSLADKLVSLLKGNQEFVMIDDQKVVYETALSLAEQSGPKEKNVLIIEGGPGTGKSVVAVNLLISLINRRMNAQYVTKNSAPRVVYESMLTGTFRKTHIGNLFKGSGSYTECPPNTFDALIVDEAHRLNEKSGMFQNKGENQIKEIMQSANFSVFFIDEDQRVTFKDIGETEQVVNWANRLGAKVHKMGLSSQFRCNGSDGYLAWLDNTLQIRETVNQTLDNKEYDFRIIDSPNELFKLINEKNKINNKARMVAGYCWDWISKKDSALMDIQIPEYDFAMRWNLNSDGQLWILKPDSVNEIGCIHTCQGLELDYVGVIIGEDLICRDDKIVTDPLKRAKTDASIKGFKTLLKQNEELALQKADLIIKNTYRTLLTRGMKGCYVYFCDKELEKYFKARLNISTDYEKLKFSDIITEEEELGIKIEKIIDRELEFVDYLPVYTLEAACGGFGEGRAVDLEGWVKVEGQGRLGRNLFVSRVKGRSMEPAIPDGSYCIFRTPVVGSRQNKIVLVQHHSIIDPDNGGQYTVKKYAREIKVDKETGEWQHEKIILSPLNTDYSPIVITRAEEEEFIVVGEFVGVLPA